MKPQEKLSLILQTRDISQSELARRSGFKQAMVNSWVNGKSRLYADQAFKLCKVLNVTTDWLLDEEIETVPAEPSVRESQIAEIIKAIGVDRAWLRLIGAEDQRTIGGVDAGPDASVRSEWRPPSVRRIIDRMTEETHKGKVDPGSA